MTAAATAPFADCQVRRPRKGLIIGTSVGSVGFVALLAIGGYLLFRKRGGGTAATQGVALAADPGRPAGQPTAQYPPNASSVIYVAPAVGFPPQQPGHPTAQYLPQSVFYQVPQQGSHAPSASPLRADDEIGAVPAYYPPSPPLAPKPSLTPTGQPIEMDGRRGYGTGEQ